MPADLRLRRDKKSRLAARLNVIAFAGRLRMDYYQGVVYEYLRADRTIFLNTEFCIQLGSGNPDQTKHWYCDAVALDFSKETIWLCEVSFSHDLQSLRERLKGWHENWAAVCDCVKKMSRTNQLCERWRVRPWVFVRGDRRVFLENKLKCVPGLLEELDPEFESLEHVAPWNYASWDRPNVVLKHMKLDQ